MPRPGQGTCIIISFIRRHSGYVGKNVTALNNSRPFQPKTQCLQLMPSLDTVSTEVKLLIVLRKLTLATLKSLLQQMICEGVGKQSRFIGRVTH